MKPFLPEIPFFCIHLESATERDWLITDLQNRFGRPIQRWKASVGADVVKLGWPRKHPIEPFTSDGAMGCLDSHLRLLQHMVDKNYEVIGIFEDDAILNGDLQKLQDLVEKASVLEPKWGILFLGVTEWVDMKVINTDIVQPVRFWGTHSFLITQEAARKTLEMHKQLQEKGYAFPADWLYARCLQNKQYIAYGPTQAKLICQKPGLVSAINGKVRT